MHEIHAKLALMKTSLAQEFYGTIRHVSFSLSIFKS